MKKFALLLIAAFTMTLVLDSCSVQKRYHRKGFTVNWNNASINKNKNRKVDNTKNIEEETIVSISKKKEVQTKNAEETFSLDLASSNTQLSVPILSDVIPPVANNIKDQNQSTSILTSTKNKPIKEDIKNTKRAVKKIIKTIKNNKPADEQKLHWAALTGFITSLVGLLVLPILFGLCGIIFSAIALSKIKRNPELYKGKGFAIAGLVIGIIAVLFVFLILAILLAVL